MNNGDKPLPYSDDAEKGVLCSLILSPLEAADLCARQNLKPEYFYAPGHKIIYQTLLAWRATDKIDFIWLKEEIKKRGQLEEVGGPEFLSELFDFVSTETNAKYYIDGIFDAWQRRSAILECHRRESAAFDVSSPASSWDPDGIFAVNGSSLKGASFLDYSKRQIDESKTLLGNRYLCRGGGLFIVAPSGIGKSVLLAQAAIELACGLPAFGIRPPWPLKSFIIQAEDDEGDIIEMAQIIDHLELSPEQRKLVAANTHLEFVNDVTGDEFLSLADSFLLRRGATDLLWLNPYTAYNGADIKDDGENTRFLRYGLNPILTKHDCGAIVLHHTPKTNFRDTAGWKPSDWMYSGAGAAVLTNWARAYLAIDPCDDPSVYKFIAAKRGKRIGWGNSFPVYEKFWAHSTEEGKLLWLPASQAQVSTAKSRGQKGPDDLLPLIPLIEPISQERLFLAAKDNPPHIGENKARGFLKILEEDGKIEEQKIRREGTKAAIGYVRATRECL